ncbi:MAG: hypothetical protein WC712_12205 [Candidatus Brocadiia bacterium]
MNAAKETGVEALPSHERGNEEALPAGPEGQKGSEVLARIRELCKKAQEDMEADPKSADKVALRVSGEATGLIRALNANGVPAPYIAQYSDRMALMIARCAAAYSLETWQWKSGMALLEDASRFAVDDEAKATIEAAKAAVKNKEKLYEGLTQIESAPSLATFNGLGAMLYGKTDVDPETGSYLATHYFVFAFLPVYPIRRYKVLPVVEETKTFGIKHTASKGYIFLGKAPLRTFDVWHRFIGLGVLALLIWAIAS